MAIQGQTATLKPPTYTYHRLTADDTAPELNEWATSLFSPLYSDQSPAFSTDSSGTIHLVERQMPVPVGFYLVFDQQGYLAALAPATFEAQYAIA